MQHQPDPAGAAFSLSSKRHQAIARRRLAILERNEQLRKSHSAPIAARLVKASIPTLWRWQQAYAARGILGLLPQTARCGRRSPFKQIRFSAASIRELELLRVKYGSACAAWRRFAQSPACPPLIARYVQRTGMAPGAIAGIGRINLVPARAFISADNRRLFIKPRLKGVLPAQIALPPKFKLVRLKQ